MTNQCNNRLHKNKRWVVCSDQFHQRQDLRHNLRHNLGLQVLQGQAGQADLQGQADQAVLKGQAVLRGQAGQAEQAVLRGSRKEAIEDRARHHLGDREEMAEMARQQE